MLIDPFGRQLTYLRISVTDRCNFRCVYCMPGEGIPWKPHNDILRFEEIAEVVRVMADEGVTEVRLTGGEPLARADVTTLVRMLAGIPGIRDISLTTNGSLLEKMAFPLAEAGLKRINVSLDTLDEQKFQRITRGGDLAQVLRGIYAAEDAGLTPIKVNVVAMRGVNDDELVNLARLSLERPWQIRFIELMPIQNQAPWGEGFPLPAEMYMPLSEVRAALMESGLESIRDKTGKGPAHEFRLKGAKGRVGFISPISEEFCGLCNRLRLTADGNLRPCLFHEVEIPLLKALRNHEPILPLIREAVACKPVGYELKMRQSPDDRYMTQIGG